MCGKTETGGWNDGQMERVADVRLPAAVVPWAGLVHDGDTLSLTDYRCWAGVSSASHMRTSEDSPRRSGPSTGRRRAYIIHDDVRLLPRGPPRVDAPPRELEPSSHASSRTAHTTAKRLQREVEVAEMRVNSLFFR